MKWRPIVAGCARRSGRSGDLLGPADRGRLWDARIGAAVAGLLACSAAVTVGSPRATRRRRTLLPEAAARAAGPAAARCRRSRADVPPALKLPPPPAALPGPPVPPAPAGVVTRPLRAAAPRPAPAPALRRPPGVAPAAAPGCCAGAVPGPTLAEQIAAGMERWEDRPAAGWLLIPVQRPADAAALLELACRNCAQETGGRHRAPDRDDVEQSPDRYREGGRHRAPDPEDDRSSGTGPATTRTSGPTRTAIVPRSAGSTPRRTTTATGAATGPGPGRQRRRGAGRGRALHPDRLADGGQASEDQEPEDEASGDDAEQPHADSSDEDEHDTQERLESDTDRSAED